MYKWFWLMLCEFMNLQRVVLEVHEFAHHTEAFSQSCLSEDPRYLCEFRCANFKCAVDQALAPPPVRYLVRGLLLETSVQLVVSSTVRLLLFSCHWYGMY